MTQLITFLPNNLPLPKSLSDTLPRNASDTIDLETSIAYCHSLARDHYENFHVGTWFLPKAIRTHAYNVYAYCRWADDLADESKDTATATALLGWWRAAFQSAMDGNSHHPVMLAVAHTIRELSLPTEPFTDLLSAFEEDQVRFRYQTFDELLAYCQKSANPVGRIFLRLLDIRNDEADRLSDLTCTGLQLANHWQDIERDLRKGRIYIPLEDMQSFGVNEEDLAAPAANDPTRRLIEFEVRRAEDFLRRGQEILPHLHGRGRLDVDLFTRGGLAICTAIRRQGYDVLHRRPRIGAIRKVFLLLGALVRCP